MSAERCNQGSATPEVPTFRSLLNVGSLASDVSSTLAMLRNWSSLNESLSPSISPLLERQLSSTNSVTCNQASGCHSSKLT